jgi:pheromone shutdown protein TraB
MLVPIFKPGLVAAVFETYIRRPRVADMETVLEDMTGLRGWYTNRVAHVFLIFIVNNLIKWPAVGTLGLLGLSGVAG